MSQILSFLAIQRDHLRNNLSDYVIGQAAHSPYALSRPLPSVESNPKGSQICTGKPSSKPVLVVIFDKTLSGN